MRKKQVFLTALASTALAFPATSGFAGWGLFQRSGCAQPVVCDTCQDPPKKKKFSLPDPPRAGAATAVPAIVTNQRAERINPQNNPANTNAAGTDPRVNQLQKDVQTLQQQLRVLTTLLQQSQGGPAPVPPMETVPAPPVENAPGQLPEPSVSAPKAN